MDVIMKNNKVYMFFLRVRGTQEGPFTKVMRNALVRGTSVIEKLYGSYVGQVLLEK
jgi:hypothetical protein